MTRSLMAALLIGAATALAAGPGAADPPQFLNQGWAKELRERFYFTPQGSRMIPLAWFKALERPDGVGMFADGAHLQRYGLIPADGPHALNPDLLPIGFAIDPAPAGPAGPQLGLTCAACHTSNVTVAGRTVRIDGGPAHFDFDRFYEDLAATVTATVFDPARFQRFAARVIATPSEAAIASLRGQFAAFQAKLAGEAAIRRPTLAAGFGRVDALTQIVNALAVQDQGDPFNLRTPNAPTSFPPLWLTPHLEFVQWNPIAGSPIGRNGGEVLGVFGVTTLAGDPGERYRSSILLNELHALEGWIADLTPPSWDEAALGPIDREAAQRGEALFAANCARCHNMKPYRRTDAAANHFGKSFIEIGKVDYKVVGTDPAYIESMAQRLVRTGPATELLQDGSAKAVMPAAAYFLATVGAVVGRAMNDAGLSPAQQAEMHGFRFAKNPDGPPKPYQPTRLTNLKAGPLAGVSTTGPYLHNGSVPTVYELLSPVSERRTVFWTGGRELDRDRLGFVSDERPGLFRYDTSLPGNRNIGHQFPSRGLAPEERKAIIAYLKTQ